MVMPERPRPQPRPRQAVNENTGEIDMSPGQVRFAITSATVHVVDEWYRSLIRATFTYNEMDHARHLESAMLPGQWRGRRDVRDVAPRPTPCRTCDDGRVHPCRAHHCSVSKIGYSAESDDSAPERETL